MKKLVLFTFLIVSLNANAVGGWITLDSDDYYLWPGTYNDNVIRLQLIGSAASSIIDPDNCAVENASSYFVQATLNKDVIARIYSLILSAKMSGQSINLYIKGCQGQNPAIQSVRI